MAPLLKAAWLVGACAIHSQSRCPAGLCGVSSKALAFDNGNSPRAQLSRRHKSPALLWVVTAVSFSFFHFLLLFFFFFSFNRPQEGENCWSQPNTDLPLALGAKGHWAARFCKQRTTNVFGVLGPPCGTQALVLTPPLHGHPILAQCLTASSCEQGCSSHLSVSVLFLLLSSACFFIPKVTVQLNAHQLEP